MLQRVAVGAAELQAVMRPEERHPMRLSVAFIIAVTLVCVRDAVVSLFAATRNGPLTGKPISPS